MLRALTLSLAFQSLALGAVTGSGSPGGEDPISHLDRRDETFDYIVVGGGTGGNVMATRLAQQSFKVALVEAGGAYEFESVAAVPAADVLPVGSDPETKAGIDWGFVTEGQPGANNRAIHYARGKCLGGS